MTMLPHPRFRHGAGRRGLSMVETVVSIAVVGGMLVAALTTVGAARTATRTTADQTIGHLLAQQLVSEILQRAYADPDGAPVFGPEFGESGSRALFDDVDDFNNWSASPPQQRDGTVMADRVGWRRNVRVRFADKTDVSKPSTADQGIKLITVTVRYNQRIVAQLKALRADGLDNINGYSAY